ncbi:MAG TPA: hypothetical protein VHC22_10610 [Pirellulales bacterium]|nr:hypothetical protein [Pirellulales bacterium]
MTRRFQFSLRAMLGLTTLAAVASAAAFSRPSAWSGALIMTAMLGIPSFLWPGAVSARGYLRAFMIGAGVPSLLGPWLATDLTYFARQFYGPDTPILWYGLNDFAQKHRASFVFVVAATLLGGISGVFARWATMERNRE